MKKQFLILQLRPEDPGADGEFQAFLNSGGLSADEVHRVRMERDGVPAVNLDDYAAIIVGGGPYNMSDSIEMKPQEQKRFEAQLSALLDQIISRDFPYLGACYGLSALAVALGGTVSKERYSEAVGPAMVSLTTAATEDPLLVGLPQSFRALLGHKEACQTVPTGAELLVTSPVCPVQMIRYRTNVYATQFHPEADAESFSERINVYKHAGYFPPEAAEDLIKEVRRAPVTTPVEILRRFVLRYR